MKVVIGVAAVGIAMMLTMSMAVIGIGGISASASVACSLPTVGLSLPTGGSLSSAQVSNADAVIAVLAQQGQSELASVSILDAAFTESDLMNKVSPHKKSYGILQETPSQGWGTKAQVENPTYAATVWLEHMAGVAGYTTMTPQALAQAVERSAHPNRYLAYVADAQATLGIGTSCASASIPAGTTSSSLPAGYVLPATTSAPARQAVAFAIAQLGKPYQWGATGPNSYDCSGLVQAAWRSAGVSIPRTTYQQVSAGTPVMSLQAIRPGDLIFIPGTDANGSLPGHVGIAIGDGYLIDAPYTGVDIRVETIQSWEKQIDAIRHIA